MKVDKNQLHVDCVQFYYYFDETLIWPTVENPALWKDGYPTCGGVHQSPIDISTSDVVGANFSLLTFVNYDKIFPETVTNNGFTGKIHSIPVSI